MSHAFSDAPHVGEGLLFKDYYDFLVKTLIHLNKIKKLMYLSKLTLVHICGMKREQ